MNELQSTLSRDVLHVKTVLTCVLNDYEEDEDHHVIILTDARENGHVISFACPPETAKDFTPGHEYNVDISVEV